MRNIKLILAYDGSRYDGWQKQGNTDNTIQGKLEDLLSKMTEETIEIHGSGRTDAGAHAYGQVANFHTHSNMSIIRMKSYLELYLPNDIGVLEIKEESQQFHSRLSARSKIYMYRIWNSEVNNVFDRKYTYQCSKPLNLKLMKEAAKYLLGEHDFKSFASNKAMKKSTVRTIYNIEINQVGQEIQIIVEGNGFLYNMVRIITGTLIEIGYGMREVEDMPKLLKSCNRELAGVTAPACGLFLVKVIYD